MYVVMVTGGMGSGKSVVVSHLATKGARVLSLDELSHEILETDEEARAELVDAFGTTILDASGDIDSARLAHAAFSSSVSVAQLNAIMHPRIVSRCADIITQSPCFEQGHADVLVIEVPLLSEVPKLASLADEVIAVEADEDVRIERATRRTGNREDVTARISLQPTDAERRVLADTVFVNDARLDDLFAIVDRWWDRHEAEGWR
jgi:dephospho-CoA kinase